MTRANWLQVIVGIVVYAVSLLVLALVIYHYTRAETFAPLDYTNPQRVLNPIIHPGEKLIVETDGKCLRSAKPLNVQPVIGSPLYRNLDTQALTVREGPVQQAPVREPGCPHLHFENVLPVGLVPGHYRLEGTDVAVEGSQVQREAWLTEPWCLTDVDGTGCP